MQIWSEIIAYRIAILAGLDAPPCFVAVDENSGETGALVEFFYGYPNEPEPARFAHAAEFLGLDDPKRGRLHNVRRNLSLSEKLKLPSAIEWWARTLAFDALIGNTDRHPENWGVFIREEKEPPPSMIERWQSIAESLLAACVEFDVPLRFTPARAEFVAALVEARRTALLEILDE